MEQKYQLIKGFLCKAFIEEYIEAIKKFNTQHYTESNLRNHSAYFSDKKPGRESYAYAVTTSEDDLPHINLSYGQTNRLRRLSHQATQEMDLPAGGRLLMNAQMYYQSSTPVPRHFDGELLDFSVRPDNSLEIRKAIRSEKVAVLTLVNDTEGGGTRLFHEDGSSEVVVGEPGDLLIFENVSCLHGVDAFQAPEIKRNDGLVRMTIGWRSLDHNTFLWDAGKVVSSLNKAQADLMHKDFLCNQWPRQFEEFNGKAAF